MLCGNGVNGTERSQGCCKFGQSSIPALFQIVYSYSKSTSAELCGHIQLHRWIKWNRKEKKKCVCQFRLLEICRCLLWTSSKRFPLNAAFRECDSIKEPKDWIFRTLSIGLIGERTFRFICHRLRLPIQVAWDLPVSTLNEFEEVSAKRSFSRMRFN